MKSRILLLLLLTTLTAAAKTRIGLPASHDAGLSGHATLYPVLPDDSLSGKSAVIICPGGSYHHLGMPHEGFRTAEWFRQHGVAAFVLRYRVSQNGHHHPCMLEDFQQALRYIRSHADAYGIDANRVGAIGFSAGGHLVLMGGALHHESLIGQPPADSLSLRPDWVAAIYPVVSMQDSIAHRKSRRNLLGHRPEPQLRERLSMELALPDDMPPVYLQASADDPVVDYRNSVVMDKALTDKHIAHQFASYPTGGHGYGMKDTPFTRSTAWPDRMWSWLKEIGMVR